jgi:hypothetical protein
MADFDATDFLTAEKIVVGPLFDILLDESAAAKI